RDALALPGRSGELAAQHVGHVDLDADRAAVPLVRGPVGASLERPDVAERALVRAAHVRVQRPCERHAANPVERAPARLLAVLHALHGPHHRTYVRSAVDVAAPFPILSGKLDDDLP